MNTTTTPPLTHENALKVYDCLKQLNISYEAVHHAPIFTSNAEVAAFNGLDVMDIKNLFLKGHKGRHHYLIVMPYDHPLDMKLLADLVGEKSLSFASDERLEKYLGCESGAVSIFGLINDADHEVIVMIDEAVANARQVGFHPNISTETLILSQEDFARFLKSLKNDIRFFTGTTAPA